MECVNLILSASDPDSIKEYYIQYVNMDHFITPAFIANFSGAIDDYFPFH